jgi:lipoprotein-anchoring transpeptidase ErfK/SrfK
MNASQDEYLHAIQQARLSLKEGDKPAARHWAQKASSLDPAKEDPWLVMAAVASPRASLGYLERALEINPHSQRAQTGMRWAEERYRAEQTAASTTQLTSVLPATAGSFSLATAAGAATKAVPAAPRRSALRPALILTAIVTLTLLVLFGAPLLRGALGASQGLGAGARQILALAQLELKPLGAQVSILAPASDMADTPTTVQNEADASGTLPVTAGSVSETQAVPQLPTSPATLQPTDTASPTPTDTATPLPTDTATLVPTDTATAAPTDTPVPTFTMTPHPTKAPLPTLGPDGLRNKPVEGDGVRWIDVDLSQQRVYAYEGQTLVNSFLVSTGLPATPTVTGQYHIYVKYLAADMTGPGYNLPDVPYVMYFYKDYGLHGTYWHHNFGHPMSHGCVNLKTSEAKWLYQWASVGTLVNVHR